MATGPQGQRSLRQLGLGRGSRIVINISGGEASLGNEVSRLIDEQDEMMAAEDEARLAAEDRGLQAAVDREWQKSFPDMTAEQVWNCRPPFAVAFLNSFPNKYQGRQLEALPAEMPAAELPATSNETPASSSQTPPADAQTRCVSSVGAMRD